MPSRSGLRAGLERGGSARYRARMRSPTLPIAMFPRRTAAQLVTVRAAALAALIGTSVALAPLPARAAEVRRVAVPCYDADTSTWTYPTKPKACGTYDPSALEVVPFTVSGIAWSGWGEKKASAKGKGRGAAYRGPLTVDVRGLKRCSSTLSIYARVVVSIPKRGAIASHAGLPCPAAE
jgi:hypothetical protein